MSEEVTPDMLDQEVRRDLRGLPKDLADAVARHLVAAGELLDEDPERALAHARFARFRASRVAVVREASGLAAYHAGEWAEALSELRASRRMGGEGHVPVMADAERALGRPERALDIARSPEARDLVPDETMELLIVVSGARRDLGEFDAAVVGLQVPELDVTRADPWTPRLFYAYAEALLSAGRVEDSVRAFLDAASTDVDGETDAEERASMVGAGDYSVPGLETDGEDPVATGADGETVATDPAEVAAATDPAEVAAADDAAEDDEAVDGGEVADAGEDEVDDLGTDPAEADVADVDDDEDAEPEDDMAAEGAEDIEDGVAQAAVDDDLIDDDDEADDTDLAADGEVAGGEVAEAADDLSEPVAGAVPHGEGSST